MGKSSKGTKPKEKRTIVSNKKKDRDQFKKEMDMLLLKKKINDIIVQVSNDKGIIENNNSIKYQKNIDLMNEKYTDIISTQYQSMFKSYIRDEYTIISVSLINKIIIDIKRNHLEGYEGRYNFNKILSTYAKEMLFNEFELILFSLYLEYIDITLYQNLFSLEDSLLFLCFFIKSKTLNQKQLNPITNFLSKKYQNFIQNYEKWYKVNKERINEILYFPYNKINQRFKEYRTPFNIYCRDNYIDYNYIVDRILTMSLPYIDVKKENNIQKNNSGQIVLDKENEAEEPNNEFIKMSDKDFHNDCNNHKFINNNFISNNVIHNTKLTFKLEDHNNINQQLSKPLININQGNIFLSENLNINNSTTNKNGVFQNNENNNTTKSVTPNNLLHSISTFNKFSTVPGNNKLLINQNYLNNQTSNYSQKLNNYEDINKANILISKKKLDDEYLNGFQSNFFLNNPLPVESQISYIYAQKPSLYDVNPYNKLNVSKNFEQEDEDLRRILRSSNDNYMKSNDCNQFGRSVFTSNPNFKKDKIITSIQIKPLNVIYNNSDDENMEINNNNNVYNNNNITSPGEGNINREKNFDINQSKNNE